MWRDWGLVEFTWERESREAPWQGRRITVQCHRLHHAGPDAVTAVLQQTNGPFPLSPPRFGPIRERVEAAGWSLEELPATDPGLRQFWQPDSRTTVLLGPAPQAAACVPTA
jgi:hypothetical protein